MTEKPRCKCPRCVAMRRNLYLAVSGASIAMIVGYFTLVDRKEVVPDAINGPTTNSNLDRTRLPGEAPGPVFKQVAEPRTSLSPESGDLTRSRDLKPADTALDKNGAVDYNSDPFGLLPRWLTQSRVEVPWKPPVVAADEERLIQNQEGPVVDSIPDVQAGSVEADSRPENDTSESAVGGPEPENGLPVPSGTPEPEEKKPAETAAASVKVASELENDNFGAAVSGLELKKEPEGPPGTTRQEGKKPDETESVSGPGPATPLPQRPKTTTPVSQSARKPLFATENKSENQSAENTEKKGREPKLAPALTSFVAMQGNDLLKDASPAEHHEPQGYITLESKPESLRNAAGRNRLPRLQEHRPKIEDESVERPDSPPRSSDDQTKRADAPAGPADDAADLQRFALDFVRTEQTGSVSQQHQFYAESVHFYGEGDLSWTGVAAATHRLQEQNQGRRLGATAPALVKGPVDGGFYVVDQPVSWSRTDGGRLTRERSMLRLRVVSTGRGGWKITSIEEVGR